MCPPEARASDCAGPAAGFEPATIAIEGGKVYALCSQIQYVERKVQSYQLELTVRQLSEETGYRDFILLQFAPNCFLINVLRRQVSRSRER